MQAVISTNEEELVSMARQGNAEAAGALFERYYLRSLRLARRILSSDIESEDVVQAAFTAAFENFGRFRGEASFHTWITRIVVNCCRMAMRDPFRRRRIVPVDTEGWDFLAIHPSSEQSPEQAAIERQLAGVVEKQVSRLPSRLRSAYTLHCDLPISEVASVLGVKIPAAKTRVFRARQALRAGLENTLQLRQ